jgi:hypothetical protein
MGQYYAAVVIDGNGEITNLNLTLKGVEYNGVKLMEHSWLGNYFCQELCYRLSQKAKRLMWIGDYAESSDLENIDKKLFEKAYKKVWSKRDSRVQMENTFNAANFTIRGKYIVNYSKKEYVDIEKYVASLNIANPEKEWIIHPLPLLVAIGNGKGGGDYYGVNEDQVGRWCGDVIFVIAEKPPEEYSLLDIIFREEREP